MTKEALSNHNLNASNDLNFIDKGATSQTFLPGVRDEKASSTDIAFLSPSGVEDPTMRKPSVLMQQTKESIPPWVVKCLAPWIDSWCKNGRLSRYNQSENDSKKTIILDEEGITSQTIFDKFKKIVLKKVSPEQETQVACVLMSKTNEQDNTILQSIIHQLTATNMPFAILVRTHNISTLKKEKASSDLSFIHVLRPFVLQENVSEEIRASWICGGLSIPDGEIMAAEDIFFKERLTERHSIFSATDRGIKKIDTIEIVNKLILNLNAVGICLVYCVQNQRHCIFVEIYVKDEVC